MPFQEDWTDSTLCRGIEFRRRRGQDVPEGGASEAVIPMYADTGCEFHTSCFSCPFSECLYIQADKHVDRVYGRYPIACREARAAFERGERNDDLDSVARVSLKKYPTAAPQWLGKAYTMEVRIA